MGVVQYSSIINEIRGKVGGAVFQKMGQSLGIRGNRSYIPSGSVKSCSSRVNLVNLASIWAKMTLAQQQAWGTAALTYTFYNSFGTVIVLNGWQLFIRIQQVMLLTGGALTLVPHNYSAQTPQITDDSPFSNYSTYWNPLLDPTNVAGSYCLYYITKLQSAIQVLKLQKFYFLYAVNTPGGDSTNLYPLCLNIWKRKPLPSERFWYKVRRFDQSVNQWIDSNVSQVTVAN